MKKTKNQLKGHSTLQENYLQRLHVFSATCESNLHGAITALLRPRNSNGEDHPAQDLANTPELL